jgi:hypothetical protein
VSRHEALRLRLAAVKGKRRQTRKGRVAEAEVETAEREAAEAAL